MEDRNDAPAWTQQSRTSLLGQAIRRARLGAGLTQEQLGYRLDTPQSVVSTWESGTLCLRIETVHGIEVALGLAPGALLIAGGYVRMVAAGSPADVNGWYFG
jgi:ribosome-binding protein aMBF1 (putative translation factor)